MIRKLLLWWALALAVVAGEPAAAQSARDPGARSLAIKARVAATTRSTRLSVISDAQMSFILTTASQTAGTSSYNRIRHTNLAKCTATGLRALDGFYGLSTSSSAGTANGVKERQWPNTVTISQSIEFDGTATDQTPHREPMRFSGTNSYTSTSSPTAYAFPTLVVSDPVVGAVAPGATFYERAGVTSASAYVLYGGFAPRGGTTGYGLDTGEGQQTNTTAEKVQDNSSGVGDITIGAYNGTPGWGAVAILGKCADGSVSQSVAKFGDSITQGSDDAAAGPLVGGPYVRAYAGYPGMLLSFPGERGVDTADLRNSAARMRAARYATHATWFYGRNDLSYWMGVQTLTASATVVQMKITWLKAAKMLMMPQDDFPGMVFIAGTILPAPTSTDGFLTLTNQSKDVYEAGRVLFNAWLRDTSATGFIAQANAQVAGVANAGVARVVDPCRNLEVNSAGVLTQDGGFAPPATTVLATGTSTGSNTAATLNDTNAAWAVNAFKGKEIHIVSGTGAGQNLSIALNTATTITVRGWTTLPDATSVYRIDDASGWNGVHPGTVGVLLAASGIDVQASMAPLPVKISALEPWWRNGRINPAYRAREGAKG